jgi:hypothetical protein
MANPVRQKFVRKPEAARVILVDQNGEPYKASGGGGSSVDIQVNGVSTSDQTVLNIINGTNTTVSNPSAGDVRIDATGGGGGSGTVTSVATTIDSTGLIRGQWELWTMALRRHRI